MSMRLIYFLSYALFSYPSIKILMISKENRPSKAGTKSLLQDMITLFLGGRFTILAKPYVVQKND